MGLKIVIDCQTDSFTNIIKCVVVYRSYSYAFWSTSLWAPDSTDNENIKDVVINI